MTDQSLKTVITELHILYLDPGPDSSVLEKKGATSMAPSADCTAGVVRWRGITAQLPAWQCEA